MKTFFLSLDCKIFRFFVTLWFEKLSGPNKQKKSSRICLSTNSLWLSDKFSSNNYRQPRRPAKTTASSAKPTLASASSSSSSFVIKIVIWMKACYLFAQSNVDIKTKLRWFLKHSFLSGSMRKILAPKDKTLTGFLSWQFFCK